MFEVIAPPCGGACFLFVKKANQKANDIGGRWLLIAIRDWNLRAIKKAVKLIGGYFFTVFETVASAIPPLRHESKLEHSIY
jgi:hypothetical protein